MLTSDNIDIKYNELVVKTSKTNVKVPKLYNSKKQFTVLGLSIVYFYINIGKIITKSDITLFLRSYGLCTLNQPNPRHIGMQYGFYFLVKNSYHPRYRRKLKPGEYSLYSVVKPHPNHNMHRHNEVSDDDFKKMKLQSNNRCKVCGSLENEPHYKNKTLITKLEKGHCDPNKSLTCENCIPICSYCNHVYGNKFIFNQNGVITKVNFTL
jgi:hypothetical protein